MKNLMLTTTILFLVLAGCSNAEQPAGGASMAGQSKDLKTAVFAGGCFWCMEPPFEKLDGVIGVISGYTGGQKTDPTYEEVSSGTTGHYEAIQITYDPEKVSYKQLLDVFWKNIDPTDAEGSFVDRGKQYGSAIFYQNDEEKRIAELSRERLEKSKVFDKPVVTEILGLQAFYKAEGYHQDYYKKNPIRYKFYRAGSGRDPFLKKVWKGLEESKSPSRKPSGEELKKRLTTIQYKVTQKDGTEPAFKNEYWDNKREGIYVDIVSGEPLFSSIDKYDSGTGWPSFTRPLEPGNIVEREDRSFFTVRTEIRSKGADSHLGHIFNDGPKPTGLRYCVNSAALRFVPKEELEKEGYGKFKVLFKQ